MFSLSVTFLIVGVTKMTYDLLANCYHQEKDGWFPHPKVVFLVFFISGCCIRLSKSNYKLKPC